MGETYTKVAWEKQPTLAPILHAHKGYCTIWRWLSHAKYCKENPLDNAICSECRRSNRIIVKQEQDHAEWCKEPRTMVPLSSRRRLANFTGWGGRRLIDRFIR